MFSYIFWNSQGGRLRAIWRLILQVLLMLAVGAGVVGILFTVLPLLISGNVSSYHSELEKLLMVLANLVPIAVSVWLAGCFLDRRKFADFGFNISASWLADLGFGLLLGAVLMAGIFLTEWAAGWVHVTATLNPASPNVPFWLSLAASFVMFVGVGFQEELFSRGYQLTNMAEGLAGSKLSKRAAICLATLLSSAIFGLLHALNPEASLMSTVNIMLAGTLLSSGYLLTGELAIPIGLHVSWNFFQGSIFGFPVSGMVLPPSVFTIQQAGDPLVTGGAFGPEAGLIGLAAMLAGTVAIAAWVRLRKGCLDLAIKLK